MEKSPVIVVFDSGFGGLTVLSEVVYAWPDASYIYCADNAAFPYGDLSEEQIVSRVHEVMERLIAEYRPDLVIIACNSASTVVLPHLRARFELPFIGTVPAIKPAAAASKSRMISVLATPGTVARDYTTDLIERFAEGCDVTLVGSRLLAGFAEAKLRGEIVRDQDILTEIQPCFVSNGNKRTDQVVLACTHYPLLLEELHRLAPWPVEFVDPAPAIARRAVALLGQNNTEHISKERVVIFTGKVPNGPGEQRLLDKFGFSETYSLNKPLSALRI